MFTLNNQFVAKLNALPWQKAAIVLLPRLILLLLIILIAARLAEITWLVVDDDQVDFSLDTSNVTNDQQIDPDLFRIKDLNLFAAVSRQPAPVQPRRTSRKPLGMELTGVLFVDQGNLPKMVLLAKANGAPEVYGVGDRIRPGVTIETIERDHVVILNNGFREELFLPKAKTEAVISARPARQDNGVVMVDASTKRKVEQYRKQMATNSYAVAGIIQGRPIVNNGEVTGVLLSNGRDPALMSALGLRTNDLLQQINGIPVGDASRIGEILELIKTEQIFDLSLVRNGRKQTLTINLDQ